MKYKHNWKVNEKSPGMYETTYQCTRCKEWHTESADNIDSNLPETGCHCPVQSDLQKLSTFNTWVCYFFLREFPGYFIDRLNLSSNTMWYIEYYNTSVKLLRGQLKSQYELNKSNILYARERESERHV